MATANVGDDVQTDFSFTLLGTTTLTDPTLVEVVLRKPDLTEVLYTFPSSPEITKLGVGSYRFTLKMLESRTHVVRPVGDGVVNKSQEVFIEVTESMFLDPLPS